MDNFSAQQAQLLEKISAFFLQDPDVRALVLCGSLADGNILPDVWSDIDLKVILSQPAEERYSYSTGWLAPYGRVLGVEKHADGAVKTLRVCLEGLQRVDLVFLAEPALRSAALGLESPFGSTHRVLWSRVEDLEGLIAALSPVGAYQEPQQAEIEELVDAFWFKAASAVAKVARSDLLIGMHLAFGLAQDCLVLQMIRRDREKRTNIHRMGGWGNELIARFSLSGGSTTDLEILQLIRLSGAILDELAAELLPGYQPRGQLLNSGIEAAIEVCRLRAV